MRVGHNIASFNIFVKYKSVLADQSSALTNISSGQKVNTSADNPYAAARSESFDLQLRNLQRTSQNSQDAVSLLQTAEGGLDNITQMLQRINELAVQNANGVYNTENRSDSQAEVTQLIDGITKIAQSTNINGINLLSSSSGTPITAKISVNIGEEISIPTFNVEAANLNDGAGNSVSNIDITTASGCKTAIDLTNAAIKTVTAIRGQYGALENRLNQNMQNSSEISLQVQNGQGEVVDSDVAYEMMRYSKDSVIVQAGIAMMAQTNKFPQEVLNILQNVR